MCGLYFVVGIVIAVTIKIINKETIVCFMNNFLKCCILVGECYCGLSFVCPCTHLHCVVLSCPVWLLHNTGYVTFQNWKGQPSCT